jgi:hypothetical protein
MKIETCPCETCDFSRFDCGRDIEDCMMHSRNKRGAGQVVIHKMSGRVIKYGDYRDDKPNQ